ncbi:MAG: beta-ketoacyl synthase N-terminal-like domain-containing protein [Bdellovibrionia bacterium]
MQHCVLITGATGFIGSEFLRRLLLWDPHCQVILLIRDGTQGQSQTAAQKFDTLAQELFRELSDPKPVLNRLSFLACDLKDPHLGLSEADYETLARKVSAIYHLAADVRFDQPLDQARISQVLSTKNLCELAKAAQQSGSFLGFHYLSTFTVAPIDPSGQAQELPPTFPREFKNTYEQTKVEAEAVLIEQSHFIPVVIYRASMVGGDSKTGWTPKLDSFYLGVRFFLYEVVGKINPIVLPQGSRIDAVTVDWVTNALFVLRTRPVHPGFQIYHLTSGHQATRLQEGLSRCAQVFQAHAQRSRLQVPPQPEWQEIPDVKPEEFKASLAQADPILRESWQVFMRLLPYAFDPYVYDNSQLREALKDSGLEVPNIRDSLPVLVDFCIRTQWGRLKEPRPPLGSCPFAPPLPPPLAASKVSSNGSRAPRSAPEPKNEPIAIVGLGGRFPQALNLRAFEQNLRSARRTLSPHAWKDWEQAFFDRMGFEKSKIGPTPARPMKWGGFLDPLNLDPEIFKIPPLTVQAMDRIQKLVLLTAHQALSDIPPSGLPPLKTAFVLGCSQSFLQVDDLQNQQLGFRLIGSLLKSQSSLGLPRFSPEELSHLDQLMAPPSIACTEDSLAGGLLNVAVGRVMSHFDFHGPSYVVNSGHSSTLAALDHAITLLRTDGAEAVITGGAHTLIDPLDWFLLFLEERLGGAPNSPFSGSGILPSEGCGLFVLKKLSSALQAGDPIWGLIRGLGQSSSGRSFGIEETSPQALISAMQSALHQAQSDPQQIHHLETQGSGVPWEDQAERQALESVYGKHPDLQLGHLASQHGFMAGAHAAASLAKVLLAFNQDVWFPELPPASPLPFSWVTDHPRSHGESPDKPIQAALSSFGGWGSAYHLIIEKWNPKNFVLKNRWSSLEQRPKQKPTPIAVIGYGANLPGSSNPENFWENLVSQKSFIAPLSDSFYAEHKELFVHSQKHPNAPTNLALSRADQAALTWTPTLPELGLGIPPSVLSILDPIQRQFLDSTLQSLKHWGLGTSKNPFGLPPGSSPELSTLPIDEILIGESKSCNQAGWMLSLQILLFRLEFYLPQVKVISITEKEALFQSLISQLGLKSLFPSEESLASLQFHSVVARVAKTLDLQKGSFSTLDAACASSLAAIGAAMHSLQMRKHRVILAGGAGVSLTPGTQILFSQCHALSPDGSRPFDTQANGILLGEATATLILKRLDDALLDGDPVHAVLLGIGASSDGRGHSMMAPDVFGQTLAMRRALESAQGSADQIQYVECHATGTPVGDSIELSALSEVYGPRSSPPLLIGSVKSQVGHTLGAAGAVALLKVILGLKKKQIPPMRVENAVHPALQLEARGLEVAQNLIPWAPGHQGSNRQAAVHAFGFGGTNWSLIVGEKPIQPHFSPSRRKTHRRKPRIAFLFPGHGSPYPDMGRAFYERFPVFRRTIQEANSVLEPLLGQTVEKLVFTSWSSRESVQKNLLETHMVQPVLLTFNLAYYRLLRELGVSGDVYLGHSVGEFAACVAGGMMPFEEALVATYQRGWIFKSHQNQGRDTGRMMAVFCSAPQTQAILQGSQPLSAQTTLAVKNCSTQTVIAAPTELITPLRLLFSQHKIDSEPLGIHVAWHSPLAKALGEDQARMAFDQLPITSPRVSVMSNLTQLDYRQSSSLSSEVRQNLVNQIGSPMNWTQCIESLFHQGVRIWVEVGPKSILTRFTEKILESKPHHSFVSDSGMDSLRTLSTRIDRAT